jgi:hypothetical protein
MEVPTPRFPICVDLLGGGNCYEIGGLRAMGTLTQVLKLNDFKPSQSQPAQVSTACRSIKPYTYISPMISNLSATRLKKKKRTLASPDNGSDITDPRVARAETYHGVRSHQFQTL